MAQSEVVSLRLEKGTRDRLKMLAWQRSVREKREIRWVDIVKSAIDDVLGENLPCQTGENADR
jgi:hypothetical protein